MPHYLIFWGVLLLTCGYALLRGRKYEQLAGLICIAASIVSLLAHSPVHQRYLNVETSDLLVDTAVLLAFVAIALRSRDWACTVITIRWAAAFASVPPFRKVSTCSTPAAEAMRLRRAPMRMARAASAR